jgi:hypothetical protein
MVEVLNFLIIISGGGMQGCIEPTTDIAGLTPDEFDQTVYSIFQSYSDLPLASQDN